MIDFYDENDFYEDDDYWTCGCCECCGHDYETCSWLNEDY